MVLRCLCLFLICVVDRSASFAQTALGEIEIDDYLRSSKLKCDSYMLTVKVEFGSEPGHWASCTGSDEFVELVSKVDGLTWRRAHRDARMYEVPPDNIYPCDSFRRQWCQLVQGTDVYGMPVDLNNTNRDPFLFAALKSVDPECLVFPELFDSPFTCASSRNEFDTVDISSRFVSSLTCIDARETDGGAVVSKWSYMNGSDNLWELESIGGFPIVVKWMRFAEPVGSKVPAGKPLGYIAFNKIEWQEDEYGKYPKKVSSIQMFGGSVFDGVAGTVDMEFKLNVDDDAYRNELAKIKKRLAELERESAK